MNKTKILYVLLEIKARELEGRTLLALEAASRGFRVVIGRNGQIKTLLNSGKLPPGIYFDKSLTRGKEKQIKAAINRSCILASQDEEAGLLDLSYEKFISVRSTTETVGMASSIFCWGKHDYEAWTRHYPDSLQKIHVSGSPRIDFWRPDFDNYFQDQIKSIRARFGKFVLISSNFTQANHYMTEEERINRAKRIGVIRNEEDVNIKRSSIKDRIKMFNCFVNLINNLSDLYKDIQFVIRPHPSEKISGWTSKLAKRDNINVVFEGSISPWVRASTAIIHNACTTGIEAYVAKVPAIAFLPFKSDRSDKIPNKMSINCFSENDVKNVLNKIIQGESIDEHRTRENDDLLKSRLNNVKGDTAAKKIVDVLEKIGSFVEEPIHAGFKGWKIGVKKDIRFILNKLLGIETKAMRKFPGLTLEELNQIKDNLANVTDKYAACNIRHLYGDVYLIEQENGW